MAIRTPASGPPYVHVWRCQETWNEGPTMAWVTLRIHGRTPTPSSPSCSVGACDGQLLAQMPLLDQQRVMGMLSATWVHSLRDGAKMAPAKIACLQHIRIRERQASRVVAQRVKCKARAISNEFRCMVSGRIILQQLAHLPPPQQPESRARRSCLSVTAVAGAGVCAAQAAALALGCTTLHIRPTKCAQTTRGATQVNGFICPPSIWQLHG